MDEASWVRERAALLLPEATDSFQSVNLPSVPTPMRLPPKSSEFQAAASRWKVVCRVYRR
jgi:hypothetical protein